MPLIREYFEERDNEKERKLLNLLIIREVILEKVIDYCKKHVKKPNSSISDYIKAVKI